MAAELAEPELLPQLDAPWLAEPRDDLEELRIAALETIARGGGPDAERAARAAIGSRRTASRCARR